MRTPATTATASIDPIVRANTWMASWFIIGALIPEENTMAAANDATATCPGFLRRICGTVIRGTVDVILFCHCNNGKDCKNKTPSFVVLQE
jgi:hypothetical protein